MQNCTRTPFCSSREATIQSPGRVRRESAAAAGRGSRCGTRRICSQRTSGRCGRAEFGLLETRKLMDMRRSGVCSACNTRTRKIIPAF
jgi:hypothetical protein